MDDWGKFNETSLPEKDFYNILNIEGITDGDFRHIKRVWEDFEMQNKDYSHDLHQRDKFLLADVLENFQNLCYNICELDAAHFLTVPWLAWQAAVKDKSRIRTINGY